MMPVTRADRDRGAVIPIVALLLPILVLVTAFAVDLGRQRADRRSAQAISDVVALDMVRVVDGRAVGIVDADPSTLDALVSSAERNGAVVDLWGSLGGGPTPRITALEWGTLDPVDNDFVALDPVGQATVVPTASRVTTEGVTDYVFQPGEGTVRRQAVATMSDEALAGFSIGSFGASIDSSQAGLIHTLVTPLLGTPPTATVAGYQGLATATVGVGALSDELIQMGALTPDGVFDTEVTTADLLLASANVLRRNGDAANADLLQGMITSETQLGGITLGDAVSVGPGGEQAALASDIDVLDMITTAAFASQCTDPSDLSTCAGLNVPAATISVPYVSAATSLQVIQGQQTAYGGVGSSARTSQLQADISAVLGSQAVGQCVPAFPLGLNCALGGLLGTVNLVDATVTLDANVRLIEGRGTISAIDCTDPLGLDISTQTSAYEITVDVTVTFGKRDVLGGLLGPTLGSLAFQLTNNASDVFDSVAFDVPPDVLGQTIRPTGTGDIGLSGLTLTPVGGTGVLGTLGGLGINVTQGQVLNLLVNPLLLALDQQVLGPLTSILGVNVVGADLSPLAIDCDNTTVLLAG